MATGPTHDTTTRIIMMGSKRQDGGMLDCLPVQTVVPLPVPLRPPSCRQQERGAGKATAKKQSSMHGLRRLVASQQLQTRPNTIRKHSATAKMRKRALADGMELVVRRQLEHVAVQGSVVEAVTTRAAA